MICDTSFIIDLMRNNPAAVSRATQLDAEKTALAITSVTVFELWRGIHKAPSSKKERLASVISGMRLLVLDEKAAKRGAEVDALLSTTSKTIEPQDSMIAGIALENEEAILTANAKHFSRVKGLKVETY